MFRIGKAKPESCTSGMLKSTVFCTASAAVADVAEKITPSASEMSTYADDTRRRRRRCPAARRPGRAGRDHHERDVPCEDGAERQDLSEQDLERRGGRHPGAARTSP
jgi:hypothetical protein